MVKVMFVCHGNICRSPMAEFVFKDMVEKRHLKDTFLFNGARTAISACARPHPVILSIGSPSGRAVKIEDFDWEGTKNLIALPKIFRQAQYDSKGSAQNDKKTIEILLRIC